MGTTLLFGAVTAILMELYKRVSSKFGQQFTNYALYIGLFVLSFAWVLLRGQQIISDETIQWVATNAVAAIGIYETVIKNFIKMIGTKE